MRQRRSGFPACIIGLLPRNIYIKVIVVYSCNYIACNNDFINS